jgi:hypothetical protein
MTTPTTVINPKRPLIVVKRVFYDAFAAGTKTTEYRRHRPPFTRRSLFPGREILIACNYNIKREPAPMLARVLSFDVMPTWQAMEYIKVSTRGDRVPSLTDMYHNLVDDDEIAAIAVELIRQKH